MTSLQQLNAALNGRYRIERELGGGGMAMVYLARDERHDRNVALKVLRPELAAVIGAERFLNEIKTTANLQHPHILPLHDSGNVDGTVWYVMPSVEGESLRDRLTRETQLPVDDALQIAREVASALDYAHRHGVIHRDIKPENILLHDGRAMVADFGIALAVSKTEGGTRITETGMSLGTPHYMSPEQALGERTIDARTDVYALGCVLYEMLAGEPPFTGPSAQAIVAKVMNTTAAPVTATRPTVPTFVDAAIARALSKLPADRFKGAAEFALALQGLGAQSSVTMTGASNAGSRDATRSPVMLRALPWGVAVVALTLALIASIRQPQADQRVTAAVLPLEIRENSDRPNNEIGPPIALSPDGSFLVFVGADPEVRGATALWKRALDGLDATMIAGTRGAYWPMVSADGRSIIFQRSGGNLPQFWEVPTGGGLPVRRSTRWRSLRGDRTLVTVDSGFEIRRGLVEEADPDARASAAGPQLRAFLNVSVSPDFQYIARTLRDSIVVRTPGPGNRAMIGAGVSPTFIDNDLLVFRAPDGTLQVGRLNENRTRFAEPPIPVVASVMTAGTGAAIYSIGDDGTLAYLPGTATGLSRLVWVDPSGREQAVPDSQPRVHNEIALSPDDGRVALTVGIIGQRQDIWLSDLRTGATTPLTRDGRSNRPKWRKDGRTLTWLHFNLLTSGEGRGRMLDASQGAEVDSQIPAVSSRNVDASAGEDSLRGPWPPLIDELVWSPDEQYVAVRTRAGGTGGGRNISVRKLDQDVLVPFAAEPAQERGPSFSPDGKWLLYVSDRSGRDEVYAESFPGGGNRAQLTIDGGREAMWSRDGTRVFYRGLDGWMMAAHVAWTGQPRVTRHERLFDANPYHDNTFLRMYDVARDGRFLMLKYEGQGPRTDVVIIRNWVQQVKARLAEIR
jgi:Tol biopolymer transport system component